MAKLTAFFIAVLTFFGSMIGIQPEVSLDGQELQTVTGWGTSSAWWSQMIENKDTREFLAKELYSKKGLGLNIYRYNIGAGVNPQKNRIWEVSHRTESFLFYNEKTKRYEYDFTRDANAQKMLFAALAQGCIDTVILFANSPHYSMTINGETSGTTEQVSNIAPEKYQTYVDYLLTITEYFISKGVPVKYLSPFNEPQWDWGGDYAGQEGCHYEPNQVEEITRLLSKGIKKRGLNIKLSVPESGQVNKGTVELFAAAKRGADKGIIGSYSYHSYWVDDNRRAKSDFGKLVKSQYNDAYIDQTEWSELPSENRMNSPASAARMARVIANDFSLSYCNSWSSWVAVNYIGKDKGKKYCDALFGSYDWNFNSVERTLNYVTLAHFTKFVPVGSKVLSTKIKNNVYIQNRTQVNSVAFRTPGGKTVFVISNEDTQRDVRLKLPSGNVTVYMTDSSHLISNVFKGSSLDKISLEKYSVVTIVVG